MASEDKPDPEDPNRIMIRKGETFYVLHYAGEGNWLVWFHGKISFVENFSNEGPFPKADWWVEIKTAKGVVGWAISNPGDFDGQDRLAELPSFPQVPG